MAQRTQTYPTSEQHKLPKDPEKPSGKRWNLDGQPIHIYAFRITHPMIDESENLYAIHVPDYSMSWRETVENDVRRRFLDHYEDSMTARGTKTPTTISIRDEYIGRMHSVRIFKYQMTPTFVASEKIPGYTYDRRSYIDFRETDRKIWEYTRRLIRDKVVPENAEFVWA